MTDTWTVAGAGVPTGFLAPVEGVLREVKTPADAVALLKNLKKGDGVIVLVHEAGGTTIGPLLGDIAGVISTTGTLGAHIALLAKEYDTPCIVGASVDVAVDNVLQARLDVDGTIHARIREAR